MNMKPFSSESLKKYIPHVFFAVVIVLLLGWVYVGLQDTQREETVPKALQPMAMNMDHSMPMDHVMPNNLGGTGKVESKDDAVRAYLNAAQIIADVYKFNNEGSYAGLCERSEDNYTLEGESGGILKYIKFVGATEVFCSTSDSEYLIEAKMPQNGQFFCIDETNTPVEQAETREGKGSCQ
jgi:hypothetical protein